MKNTLTMMALLATASLISACSGSGGGSSSESPSTPSAPELKGDGSGPAPGSLIGSFRGTDAYCSDGSKAETTRDYIVDTVYTFREDGTFSSETTKDGKVVAGYDGKYKLEGDVLTMVSGQDTSTSTHKIVGDELILNYGKVNDGACPEGQDLLETFARINTGEEVTPVPAPEPAPAPAPSEADSKKNKTPRGPSKVPKPK